MDRRFTNPHADKIDAITHAVLERIRLDSWVKITRQVIETVTVEQIVDVLTPDIMLELQAIVLGERVDRQTAVAESETIDTPATWWDHWKQSHVDTPLIGWFVKRHPPNMVRHVLRTNIEMARYYMYPQAPIDSLGDAWQNVLVTRRHSHIGQWPL